MRIDWHRLRPSELLVLASGLALAVALFLPWYGFPLGRRNAWQALDGVEVPSALAALAAFVLVVTTLRQRSPALPLAIAVWTVVLAALSSALVAAEALAPPGGATDRCYGLWLGLGASVLLVGAAMLSLRDERPFWGVPVSR